jgi:hypothetical protein
LLLSFPLFSLLYLRFLSGTFSALRYLSPTVRSLTYPILAIYIFGIFALAVMSLSNKKLT